MMRHLHAGTSTIRRAHALFALGLAVAVAACATSGLPSGTSRAPAPGIGSISSDSQWPMSTREHVDLWLHGYAVLTTDTARVPFFQRGYRQRMRDLKNQRNVYTQLDANAEQLSARFLANPSLVNGQFVPLYFSSFEQIQQVVAAFLQSGGRVGAARDPTMQAYFGLLNGTFPSAADRDWLRLFVQCLGDEDRRFYHDYWNQQQTARTATRTAVDSLWARVYRPRLQRFLNNTQQENGELILSLPLDGEGRSVNFSRQQNAVAVAYPDSVAGAVEAIYVLAHEVVNAITTTAIKDNTTPAEQRSGASGAYTANATVRGGALLLQKAAPELLQGYMRYYLRSAGLSVPTGDASAVFASTFTLPDAIRDAISRQLDVVLGGI
ncbi:MAG TPA: hypothetical protein VJU87_12020 [Gemmatimonadaceae bacterium]|nr:hypothetical protein [Gemmatimonadaceae bacterium]